MDRRFHEILILTGGLALALLVSPLAGRAASPLRAVLATVLVAALSVMYGRAIFRWLPVSPRPGSAGAFIVVTGFSGVSLLHLATTAGLNVGVGPALALDIAVGAILTLIPDTPPHDDQRPLPSSETWLDAGAIFLSAALAYLWARETVLAVPHVRTTGVFPAWQDFLLHASEITYIRDYPVFGMHSQYLTAVPQPLYHRASYAMAAVFSAVSGASSLATTTAFWLPAGLLLCVLATFAFGAALGGSRLAGLAAVGVVFLFPDASTYGFHNRFLSVHWLIQIAGGSGYAVALTLMALVVIVAARPESRPRALAAAAVLVAAAAPFRVHVAVLASGMMALLVLSSWRKAPPAKLVLAGGLALVVAAAVLVWLESVALAPHFLTHAAQPVLFFQSVHSQASAMPTPYTAWIAGRGDIWALVVGYLMMLASGCGVWLIALILGWATGSFGSMGWRAAAIPAALLIAHVAVILLVPTPAHGDPTDFGHRPFVLVYVVVAAMSGALIARWVGRWSFNRFHTDRAATLVVTVLCAAGCLVPWFVGARVQQRWTPSYSTIAMGTDVVGAGEVVRAQSQPGDVVLTASEDPLAVFVALTERGAFLSRTDLYRSLGAPTAALAEERAAVSARFRRVSTLDELRQLGRSAGVSWYVADTPDSGQWPSDLRDRCAYCGQTIRAYDLR